LNLVCKFILYHCIRTLLAQCFIYFLYYNKLKPTIIYIFPSSVRVQCNSLPGIILSSTIHVSPWLSECCSKSIIIIFAEISLLFCKLCSTTIGSGDGGHAPFLHFYWKMLASNYKDQETLIEQSTTLIDHQITLIEQLLTFLLKIVSSCFSTIVEASKILYQSF